MKNKTALFADLGLLVVAIVWGFGFVATKNALDSFTPFYLMAVRFAMAFAILAVIFHKKLLQIKKSDLLGSSIVAFFLFTAFAFQTVGLQYTDPGKQAFITGTNVVIVPFLFWFLYKHRPDWRSFLAAFVCLMGMGLLTLNSSLSINIGDALTFGCAILFAGHIVSNGFFANKIDPVILTILQFAYTAIFSLLVAVIFEPYPSNVTPQGLSSIIYLGIFSTCLAFFLQTLCQKYTLSTHAAILLSTESLFGSIFSALILGEIFTSKMMIGCAAILAAILIAELKPAEKTAS